tara:strand:+ start:967 stop:2160 length:1194 start_codon:yes stop_codon:yes gene_type:complete
MTNKNDPAFVKLDIFCKGLFIDKSCELEKDARAILRTRGGLGSGLEMILPKGIWANAPLEEHFVKNSPYKLFKENGQYKLYCKDEFLFEVTPPPRPKFYDLETSSGKKMSRIGVMQGTYLGIYANELCNFWDMKPKQNCRFCSIGLNIGKTEEEVKTVQDVVETIKAAMKEEKITFVHFNTGFMYGRGVKSLLPFIKAVKKETGLLVGVQCPPAEDFKIYDELKSLGVDHLSFCIEIFSPNYFKEVCPGKDAKISQQRYLDAIAYTSKLFGKGRVAGEIIAGLEPVKDSIAGIEWFAEHGAVTTLCVFRPCLGTNFANRDPPKVKEVLPAFERLYDAAIENDVLLNMAPNIRTAMVMLPEECKAFSNKNNLGFKLREAKQNLIRIVARAYFAAKLFK